MVQNLIVFGAHGKVGQQIIRQVANSASRFKATAIVRNKDQAATIAEISSKSSDLRSRELTLDAASVEDLAREIKGHDAVIFTAGSGGKDLLKVDLDGAVKTFEASVLAQVKRFVIVSAVHADNRDAFSKTSLVDYYIAKHYADRILISEFSDKLDFTILKPTYLSDDESTGKISIITDPKHLGTKVPRADVAKVALEIVDKQNTFGKSYDFETGDQDITDPATFK